MLGTGFEILTPLSKLHRVSYLFDKDSGATFNAGEWGELAADGTITVAGSGAATGNYKLVITRVGDSEYESHDVEVGRISAVDTASTRVWAASNLFSGGTLPTAPMQYLKVDESAGEEGKLIVIATETASAVGRVQEVHADHVVYEIMQATDVTVA